MNLINSHSHDKYASMKKNAETNSMKFVATPIATMNERTEISR